MLDLVDRGNGLVGFSLKRKERGRRSALQVEAETKRVSLKENAERTHHLVLLRVRDLAGEKLFAEEGLGRKRSSDTDD